MYIVIKDFIHTKTKKHYKVNDEIEVPNIAELEAKGIVKKVELKEKRHANKTKSK